MQKYAICIGKARLVVVYGRMLADLFGRSQAIRRKSEIMQISTYLPVQQYQLLSSYLKSTRFNLK